MSLQRRQLLALGAGLAGSGSVLAQTGARPKRVGMGIPGIVDIPRGVTKFLPNLMGHWKDVPAGDTLSKLAKQYLGDASRYMEIFNANKSILSDPNMIKVGQKLTIPTR